MSGLETAVTVLKVVPPAADAGKKFLDVLGRKELIQTRRERDDALLELAASQDRVATLEQEREDDSKVIDNLFAEVSEIKTALTDVQTDFDDYRHTMDLVMLGGGAVIIVLLAVVVVVAVRA